MGVLLSTFLRNSLFTSCINLKLVVVTLVVPHTPISMNRLRIFGVVLASYAAAASYIYGSTMYKFHEEGSICEVILHGIV